MSFCSSLDYKFIVKISSCLPASETPLSSDRPFVSCVIESDDFRKKDGKFSGMLGCNIIFAAFCSCKGPVASLG